MTEPPTAPSSEFTGGYTEALDDVEAMICDMYGLAPYTDLEAGDDSWSEAQWTGANILRRLQRLRQLGGAAAVLHELASAAAPASVPEQTVVFPLVDHLEERASELLSEANRLRGLVPEWPR